MASAVQILPSVLVGEIFSRGYWLVGHLVIIWRSSSNLIAWLELISIQNVLQFPYITVEAVVRVVCLFDSRM